jgi:hypothetical protein
MMTWMEERNQKWDSRHMVDKLWVAGIANIIVKPRTASDSATTKVLAKQKQRGDSTTTIATTKRPAAMNSGCRIETGANVPAPATPLKEGAHTNPHN